MGHARQRRARDARRHPCCMRQPLRLITDAGVVCRTRIGYALSMKTLRRKKTRRERATALLGDYMKVKAASKAAKGAGKAVKGTAVVKASKGAAKRTPLKPLAIVGALGAAGIL